MPIPSVGCASNDDCASDEYCRFASGCGASGTCTSRPEGCTADCPGVCGCDGKTYCNGCGAAVQGVSVKHAGSCPQSCTEILALHVAAVEAAKSCTGSGSECGLKVWGGLWDKQQPCPGPCQTHVDPTNIAALQTMKLFIGEWVAKGCGLEAPPPNLTCPAVFPACPVLPPSGHCGVLGRCEDFPDK